MSKETTKTENWNTNLGVMLAVAGSAVGFGNFLRFPGLAAQYGGGAFMIAYFCAFLLLGIPISWIEWTVGRRGGNLGTHSTAAIFYRITGSPAWKYLGIMGVLSPLALGMYYIYLEAWTLGYAWHTAVGDLSLNSIDEYGAFFANFVGLPGDGHIFSLESSALLFFALVLLANFYLIYRGVSKGIEWFCKWSMPVLVVICLVILARVLTMGTPDAAHPERNVSQGLGYMWNPDKVVLVDSVSGATLDMVPANATPAQTTALIKKTEKANPEAVVEKRSISILRGLLNPELWLAAAGQVFFSLSVGFGTVCTYASYVRSHKDIALSSLTANAANASAEVGLAGMMIIPAAVGLLGVAAAATTSTFGLGFNVLPLVFHNMPGGQLFGTLFFLLLFIAAVTSAISMLQPGIAFLEEFWGLGRMQSVTLLGLILACGTLLVAWFTTDLLALDTLDFWFGNISLYVTTGLYLYLFNVAWGNKKGMAELRHGAAMSVPSIVGPIVAWITPTIMVTIFAAWVFQNIVGKPCAYITNILELKPGAIFPLVWVLLVAIFFAFVIHTSNRFHKRNK
ncbi:MAG: sodium-dependent transporter [Akkermansia sp.]|nr:sodium-dependent transporter [Akkermansia sp.]